MYVCLSVCHNCKQASIDVNFDAGGKISSGLIATTIVSQWTWAATLLQSTSVTTKVSTLTQSHLYLTSLPSTAVSMINNFSRSQIVKYTVEVVTYVSRKRCYIHSHVVARSNHVISDDLESLSMSLVYCRLIIIRFLLQLCSSL